MIIGLAGKKQSGKDSVADIIIEHNPEFKKVAFADKVKECCAYCFRIQLETLYKGCKDTAVHMMDFHELFTGSERMIDWLASHGIELDDEQKNWLFQEMFNLNDFTYRGILQFIGTDIGRNLDDNLWITLLLDQIQVGDWIVTDARFENEREALREVGCPIWLINRDLKSNDTHKSENDLDYDYDVTIDNNEDLESLKEKVLGLL